MDGPLIERAEQDPTAGQVRLAVCLGSGLIGLGRAVMGAVFLAARWVTVEADGPGQ